MLPAPSWPDRIREALIFAGLLFAPWAFGSTQPWSIWTMNVVGYSLGALTLVITGLNWRRARGEVAEKSSARTTRILGRCLGSLTALVLFYVLVSFFNAAADYDDQTGVFSYRTGFLEWLPHTFNRQKTLQYFCDYAALACFFWATVDWLRSEPQDAREKNRSFILSARFRRLLWLLAINGALLAAEGIVQRLEGSGKLLFLVKPRVNPGAEAQFGPYAYRANAAQYLNLIWPVTIGFWLCLHRAVQRGVRISRRASRQFHHTLIPLALVMGVAPLVSTSRGGALVLAGNMAAITVVIWLAFRDEHWTARWGVPAALILALGFGFDLGWKRLNPRIKTMSDAFVDRERLYENGRRIVSDYPVFGTGAGSLDSVYQLYRQSPEDQWPVQLHNDWVETLATFGWVGASMIWLALVLVLARWFFPGPLRANKYFVACLWIALAGCLVHARWDFPFQIYSIVHLFITLCAVIFCVSRKVCPG